MEPQKILITGGAGYIGARLSKELAELGHKVTPLCHKFMPEDSNWLKLMEDDLIGDITDRRTVEALTNYQFDVMIHLVSLDHRQSEVDPYYAKRVNVQPLWDLLHNFARKGNLKRCIYFSTVQVYGKAGNGIISEQTLPEPVNVYGITHYICEEICNFFTRTGRIECVNLRLANSYGQPVFKENNCWQLVINDLCRQAVETGRIVLLSDGSPQRDFIHYDDIVAAVNLFLMTECWGDKTYNLCSGQTYTILELAEIVKDCCKTKIGRDVTISSKSQFRNKADYSKSPSKTIWNNAALTSLGFKSVTQLHVGVDSMIDYLVQR